MSDATRSALGDEFDRTVRSLTGLPDVISTKASTVRHVTPVLNQAQTFIVQTYRQAERGDTVLIEYVDANGSFRMVIPPGVADTIARQRDALTTKRRVQIGKQAAAERKAAGLAPAFQKKEKK